MLAHRRVTPSTKFSGTNLYTWVGSGTVRVKCLAQEHSTMFSARASSWTARSGVKRSYHEATTPPLPCTYSVLKAWYKEKHNHLMIRFCEGILYLICKFYRRSTLCATFFFCCINAVGLIKCYWLTIYPVEYPSKAESFFESGCPWLDMTVEEL